MQWGSYRNNPEESKGTRHLNDDTPYSDKILQWVIDHKIPINTGETYCTKNSITTYLKKNNLKPKITNKIRLNHLFGRQEPNGKQLEELKNTDIQTLIDNFPKELVVLYDDIKIDTLLIHSPLGSPHGSRMDELDLKFWTIICAIGEKEQITTGVSNYSIESLEVISKLKKPAVNEIEVSPYITRKKLIEYCKNKNIKVTTYWSLRGNEQELLKEPIIVELSKKHNTLPGTIIHKWIESKGLTPIVGSYKLHELNQVIKLINLTEKEVLAIDSLDMNLSFSQRNPTSNRSWGWSSRDKITENKEI